MTHDQEEAMVMSDRIALLRSGELEQVASPREIYSKPATAYTAQFIGHTNLLKAEVHAGMATCWTLKWPTSETDGTRLYSLRPECIRFAGTGSGNVVRFPARIRDRVFHGATELMRVEIQGGLLLTVRTSQRDTATGEIEFEFTPSDAAPVRPSEERV